MSTKLHEAASSGNLDSVSQLLDSGADINERDQHGRTPLFSARDPRMIQLLLDRNAEVNARDVLGGCTPLGLAAVSAYGIDIVKVLLENGADANTKNDAGVSVLINASLNGRLEVVKLLLENGADPTYKDNNGKTAVTVAREEGHKDVVKLLNQYGSSNEAQGSRCFIATAACGTQDATEVLRLQEFRDLILARTLFGRAFIASYEVVSPTFAFLIARSKIARSATRFFLVRPLYRFAEVVLSRKSSGGDTKARLRA